MLFIDQDMDWNICILKKLEESNFGAITNWLVNYIVHLNSCIAIVQNGFLNSRESFLAKFTFKESVFPVIDDLSILCEELSHFHFIFGKSTCLSTANLLNTTHPLWSFKVFDKDLLFKHFVNAKSKRYSDCYWKSIRNCHNDQNDHDVQKGNNFLSNISKLGCDTFRRIFDVNEIISVDLYDRWSDFSINIIFGDWE